MQWSDVRKAYPDQWLIIEAIEAHSTDNQRVLDRIAVVETCRDGAEALQCYRRLHQQHPEREFYAITDFEVNVGAMDYGMDLNGILGMDFLLTAGAVINLSTLNLTFQSAVTPVRDETG